MKRLIIFILIFVPVIAFCFLYQNKEAKILFVGDMMFDRYIRQVSEKRGGDYIFSCLDTFLKDADLVVGNLEGPITDNSSKSLGSEIGSHDNFTFTFPVATAKLLADNNIKLVNLGNNHIGNFGTEGIFATKRALNEAGVKYFGGLGRDLPVQAGEQIYRTKIGEHEISFISYNEFGGESEDQVAQKISDEKKSGRAVIVYAHWGEEYVVTPERIKNTAALFAKSGADFIIGSHSHVILPSETLQLSSGQKTVVYYSLGNFIFDQYWNKNVSTGLLLELHIKGTPDHWSITEHKVSLGRDGRTCLKN